MADSQATLAGKTALITGSAKRIGAAIAAALAGHGVRVVLHYNRSRQEATDLRDRIASDGVDAWLVQADLADAKQVERLFEEAAAHAGAIDVLVNNASIYPRETLWETSAESLQRNMQIHATAPLLLARAFAAQHRPGHIINLLDTRITSYDKRHAAYHISKRALLTVTRMLAMELAPDIAVNAVAPGLILPPEGEDENYLQKLAQYNPMNRYGGPQDVADAVLFLLSSRFITGQVLFVDGGYHMKGHLYD